MTIDEAKKLAGELLSEKRYTHTANVAAQAKILALRFGANVEKAQLAAWLHDIAKEMSQNALLQLARRGGIMAELERRPVQVWHGPCAALYAKEEFNVQDEEVLSAIACHTTGKQNMSLLDKVIYLADYISSERDFEGVEELRQLAETNLDAAVVRGMQISLEQLKQAEKPLDDDTIAALSYLTHKQGKTRGIKT